MNGFCRWLNTRGRVGVGCSGGFDSLDCGKSALNHVSHLARDIIENLIDASWLRLDGLCSGLGAADRYHRPLKARGLGLDNRRRSGRSATDLGCLLPELNDGLDATVNLRPRTSQSQLQPLCCR